MGILSKQIKKTKQSEKKKSSPYSVDDCVFSPTGIDLIDFYGGTAYNDSYNIGLPLGKVTMLIGHSQSGKTTAAIQFAHAITSGRNGDVVIFDFERASTNPKNRICKICGISESEYEDQFTIFNQSTMTADFMKKFIFDDIIAPKKALGKEDMIDWTDLDGKPTKIYPPTVLIIDSVSAIRSKEMLESKELDSNMAGASIAKSNSNFITSIEPFLEEYNITILAIGHITTKITINPYEAKRIQLPGLGDSEHIPGGNKFIYFSSYVIKLTAGAEFKEDKDFKFSGRIVNAKLLKTRSGFNNNTLPLVYHSNLGFHNVLTNIVWAKAQGLLKGGGSAGFFLPEMPGVKFTQAQFMKTYRSNEEFANAFDTLIAEKLCEIIDKKETADDTGSPSKTSKNSEDYIEEEFED